ncbi:MAG: glycosyltransferase [Lachnospiraceae bacterium]|nr:glycosyltransferase [Lachnospiraceae bacterium]
MKKVSVLMSVFNEPVGMLRESIDSILKQSYKEIEFIIVLDNPQNTLVFQLLKDYSSADGRIVLLVNDKNIGLAMSLNRALSLATGEYVARMDADDISSLNRIEEEIRFLEEKSYDMVFSDRVDIDENGKKLRLKEIESHSDKYIENVLPYNCIVNHPSILIKTNVIKELSGYRNFHASQDYDLWLRLLTSGYRIGCVPKPLIRYRIRQGSISKGKRFIQFETARYIRSLYYERKKCGFDSYSLEAYTAYLTKRGVYDVRIQNKFSDSMNFYEKAMISRSRGETKEFLKNFIKSLKGLEWVRYVVLITLKERKISVPYL